MGFSEGPDRGHAWVIAFAACVITMILSGISKMVGILYVAVIDTYGVSRRQATLPFTFRKSIRCLAGPLVGVVGQRFGIRAVTMAGGLVASLGAGLAFFAPTVTWLAVCWGGIHGLGEAFANTLFQVVVNQYFEKYRSTASGIAMSGACVGSVIFSFLIEALRDAYGLQGTFLVLGGVILHVLPAAILLQPPSWISNGAKRFTELTHLKETFQQQPRTYGIAEDCTKSNSLRKMTDPLINPFILEKDKTVKPFLKTYSTINLIESLEKRLDGSQVHDNLAFTSEFECNHEKALMETIPNIQNVLVSSKDYIRLTSSNDSSRKSSLKTTSVNSGNAGKYSGDLDSTSMLASVRAIARLYANPVYLLICVCMAAYVLVFTPIMTSMVDYGKDKGLPETVGKYLIHAMALGDIIGRVCFGWVTDNDLISIPHYMTITLVLQGIFIILIPFAFNLASFLILLAFYSMSVGSMVVRLPVIVLQNVKKEEQSVAMGSFAFPSGLVPLGVPMLIGHFRDNFGSYDGMYYLLGGVSILSGAFWMLEPALGRLNSRLEERRGEISNV